MNFVKWQTKLIQCFLINNIHAHSCTSCNRVFHSSPKVSCKLSIEQHEVHVHVHGPNPNMYKDERVRLEGVPFLNGEHARKIIDMFQGTKCTSCVDEANSRYFRKKERHRSRRDFKKETYREALY